MLLNMVFQRLCFFVLLLSSAHGVARVHSEDHPPPGADIQEDVTYNLQSVGPYGSSLYDIISEDMYDDKVQLIDLTAPSSYKQGYDIAFLMSNAFIENYNSILFYLLGDAPLLDKLFNEFLDWQWDKYLSKEVPDLYMEEMEGMTQAGRKVHASEDIGRIASRAAVIANFPGDLKNLKLIFEDERAHPPAWNINMNDTLRENILDLVDNLASKWKGLSCSMFGVWGTRTDKGQLYTGRNLDWLPQMGISTHKLITIHHPPSGLYAHASVGWAGIWGAITGISSMGVTVHEANLESDDVTFRGFPWVLRHRHIMSHAATLTEAIGLWNTTNNTVGFNHGVGAAKDGQAVVLETMQSHTAVFHANDPREQDLVVDGQQIGAPRPEAVYRTNHGYDPYTVEHFLWENGSSNYNYSIQRYLLFPDLFDSYSLANTPISYQEAINITAIVADKGDQHLYDCLPPYDEGWNILSVTFDTANSVAYTAWENGVDDTYTCAACNSYLKIDMSKWF
mmetsp:Transcript_30109/g.50348  ORF Transcript_30109/g.50348 Transcript_30109/m.50348 type:complete len:507 (-) Transcript_30109:12-1532(-)